MEVIPLFYTQAENLKQRLFNAAARRSKSIGQITQCKTVKIALLKHSQLG